MAQSDGGTVGMSAVVLDCPRACARAARVVAVSVMVADGDYGASTCGPLLKQFLTAVNAG